MKIVVSIRVRNSEFYDAFEAFKKSECDVRFKEWEDYNDDKIQKYSDFVSFEYRFDVNHYEVNKSNKFDIEVLNFDHEKSDTPTKNIIQLDNVCVVEFWGDNKRSVVVVSRELLFQKINIEKNKGGNEYLYFYINENSPYQRLSDNIWLSNNIVSTIKEQIKNFKIEEDPDIIVTSTGRLIGNQYL